MRGILAAFQFLTAVPVRVQLDERDFERAPVWFPLVGLVLGASAALADGAFGTLGFSGLVRSVLAIGFLAALSGGLHLDGLADTADGFLSARPRARALEIMRDSHIGTMGVLALGFVLALKVAALGDLDDSLRWRALLIAALAGRCWQVVVLVVLPYAREGGGLASIFLRARGGALAVWAVLWLAVGAVLATGFARGVAWCLVAAVVVVVLSLWSLRRIGGFTGDTLGATSEMVETAILLAACCGG